MFDFLNQEFFILIGLFVSVVLLVTGLIGVFSSRDTVSKRMANAGQDASLMQSDQTLQFQGTSSRWSRFLRPIDKKIGPKNMAARSTVRRQLIRAGHYSPTATEIYFALRIILVFIVPPLAMLLSRMAFGNPSSAIIFTSIFGGAVLGFYLPFIYVHNQIGKRQQSVRDALPDALDLLLVCVEAGASLAGGFKRVSEELVKIHPIMAEQMNLISLELQAGIGRSDSLRNFADRVDIDEVKSLVTLLIQSETLGTSLARALRVHAGEMRSARMLVAEEAANKLPVKLSLPLVLFILPSLMTVIMTPLAIRIMRTLLTSGVQ